MFMRCGWCVRGSCWVHRVAGGMRERCRDMQLQYNQLSGTVSLPAGVLRRRYVHECGFLQEPEGSVVVVSDACQHVSHQLCNHAMEIVSCTVTIYRRPCCPPLSIRHPQSLAQVPLRSFLLSLLPTFHAFLHSFLPAFLPSCLPSCLPACLPACLPSEN